jgi:TRAP-type C4-dicarboxylate transport system substrate-binding protein
MKTKRQMFGLTIFLTVLVLVTIAGTGFAQSKSSLKKPMTLLFNGSYARPTEPMGMTMLHFEKLVTERTNGMVKFTNVWAKAMSKSGEELDMCAEGASALAITTVSYYPTRLMLNNITTALPFSATNVWDFLKITETLHYQDTLCEKEFEKNGVKFLFSEHVPSWELLSKKPVIKLDDFRGMKIAVTGDVPAKMLTTVGAVPVPAMLMDRGPGLQTGMLDGSALLNSLHYAVKIQEFAKYHTPLDWGCSDTGMAVIRLELFKSLPKDVQDIIVAAGKEANQYFTKLNLEMEEKNLKEYEKMGIVMNPSLTYEEKKKWGEMMPTIVADWVKDGESRGLPAKKLMKRYIELTKAAGYKFPYEWKID